LSSPSKPPAPAPTGILKALATRVIRRAPRDTLELHSDDPALDHAQAMARYQQLRSEEEKDGELNPVCFTKVLTHERKVERAIILMHGMTNCPEQYAGLAPRFFERGYNVIIPRMPLNGLINPDTTALRNVSAEQLRDCCNAMVDIAHGLGERITYAGISAGGTMAAWVAQNRSDVERAVLIAPAFTISPGMGVRASRLAMRLLLIMPNMMTQRFRPFTGGVGHNYRGFATRGLGQVMRLGFSVYDAAAKKRPAAQSVLVITNAADPAVSNGITYSLLRRWKASGLKRLDSCVFDASYHLIHDIIDPCQQEQQVALVYPILLDLVAGPQSPQQA
jgi:esterase/lipase